MPKFWPNIEKLAIIGNYSLSEPKEFYMGEVICDVNRESGFGSHENAVGIIPCKILQPEM